MQYIYLNKLKPTTKLSNHKGWVSGKVNVMSEIKDKRTHFISQKALDERKKLLRLIKGEERAINECEKWIGFFERRLRMVKSHPRYQSEDGTISMRQQRSIKKAEENIQHWTSAANMHKKFKKYHMSFL